MNLRYQPGGANGNYFLEDVATGYGASATFTASTAAVPGPDPGAGTLSWLIAALAAGVYLGWRRFRPSSPLTGPASA